MTVVLLGLAGVPRAMLAAAVAVTVVMGATWVVSLVRRDASLADVVWGSGFVVVAVVVAAVVDGDPGRRWLLVALTSVWGLRLTAYLGWRHHGQGEDVRYQAIRRRYGDRFPLLSLVSVFGLQGALMWAVSLPVQLGPVRAEPGLGPLAVAGVAVWLVGLVFETVGDAQLARFKADPAHRGQVMDRGLWRYTRHPNYFGDALVWWGIALVAAETPLGRWGLLGAALMTFLLRRVSGVTHLERTIGQRRPGYAEYVARTSPFLPRPPRRTGG